VAVCKMTIDEKEQSQRKKDEREGKKYSK